MAYYYLIAQLPSLVYDQKPPMSSLEFKEMARSYMNKKDGSLIDRISFNFDFSKKLKTGCNFIDNWLNWELALRMNLAKQRVIRLKRENVQMAEPPAFPTEAVMTALKAIDEQSPLEGELLIDKARWSVIDDFAGNSYFGRNNVYAYYLKLLILERRQTFNSEKGFEEYKSLYAFIVESAQKTLGEHK